MQVLMEEQLSQGYQHGKQLSDKGSSKCRAKQTQEASLLFPLQIPVEGPVQEEYLESHKVHT